MLGTEASHFDSRVKCAVGQEWRAVAESESVMDHSVKEMIESNTG